VKGNTSFWEVLIGASALSVLLFSAFFLRRSFIRDNDPNGQPTFQEDISPAEIVIYLSHLMFL
jgi:hypothetical protein